MGLPEDGRLDAPPDLSPSALPLTSPPATSPAWGTPDEPVGVRTLVAIFQAAIPPNRLAHRRLCSSSRPFTGKMAAAVKLTPF